MFTGDAGDMFAFSGNVTLFMLESDVDVALIFPCVLPQLTD